MGKRENRYSKQEKEKVKKSKRWGSEWTREGNKAGHGVPGPTRGATWFKLIRVFCLLT